MIDLIALTFSASIGIWLLHDSRPKSPRYMPRKPRARRYVRIAGGR